MNGCFAVRCAMFPWRNCDCDTFGPKWIWSSDIWSPTIGPQLISPSGQTVPKRFSPHGQIGTPKFGLHGQMVPNQFGPPGQMVLRIFCFSSGTGCGDPEIWGPNFWGPFVHGHRIWWGLSVQRDQFYGDHLSRGTESGVPEVRGSNGFGTKFVAAEIVRACY